MDNFKKKVFEVSEIKTEATETGFYVTGYANTKNRADAYGDIPTNYKGRDVYDLSRFKRNPVALANHANDTSAVVGAFVFNGEAGTKENDKGLFFKVKLMDLEDAFEPGAKHTISAIRKGFIRALSIGGQWFFEDKDNKTHLTKAIIHEISFVAIPADSHAMASIPKPKSNPETTEELPAQKVVEALVKAYQVTENESILEAIEIIKELQNENKN